MTQTPLVRSLEGAAPTIAPSAWMATGVVVVGRVTLEARANIWYNAVIRGDGASIVVGEDTNVQDGCVIHVGATYPARLGPRVSVGHAAVLHGCTIEEDCLIGMNAVVLDGAHIGAGSLVAAGSVVLEGSTIPPGSLVTGVPGKVRRELTEEEKQSLKDNTAEYLQLRDLHEAAE